MIDFLIYASVKDPTFGAVPVPFFKFLPDPTVSHSSFPPVSNIHIFTVQ